MAGRCPQGCHWRRHVGVHFRPVLRAHLIPDKTHDEPQLVAIEVLHAVAREFAPFGRVHAPGCDRQDVCFFGVEVNGEFAVETFQRMN